MAIIRVSASTVTVIDSASVAAVSDGNFSNEDNDNALTSANTSKYPMCDFVLEVTSGTMTAGQIIGLYMRVLNIDGTDDMPSPDSSYEHELVAQVPVDGVTSQFLLFRDVALPNLEGGASLDFQIKNDGGATMTANAWGLKATPHSVKDDGL